MSKICFINNKAEAKIAVAIADEMGYESTVNTWYKQYTHNVMTAWGMSNHDEGREMIKRIHDDVQQRRQRIEAAR